MQFQPFRMEYLRGDRKFVDALSRPPQVNCISLADIKQSQRSDAYLKSLRSGKPCPPQLTFRNQNYYHTNGRLFVPLANRRTILKACHDNPGHFGLELTLLSLRKTFYWPNLYSNTANFVASCDTCQTANPVRPKTTSPLSSIKPTALSFGDSFHLDLVDMPRSSAGHVAICTVVDAATRFVIVHPCMDKTHIGVLDALRTRVFPNFGCPKLIVTDKGKENVNRKVSRFLRNYHIAHITSSTGHPQSNGMWHEALPDFQTIINSTNSASRKPSPFFLTYFRHPHFPFQHLANREHNLNEHSSVEARLNLSRSILQEAADHVESYHALTKTQFDKTVKDRHFPVGSKVFVQTSQQAGRSKKLAKPFKGPYTCIEELSNGNIRLVPMNGGRTISIHKNNCKLAPHRSQHLSFDEPEPTTRDPVRFSSIDAPVPFDDTPDDTPDNNDRTTPEPKEPPDPDPGEPDTPREPGPARAPLDLGLRQKRPPWTSQKLVRLLASQAKNYPLYQV